MSNIPTSALMILDLIHELSELGLSLHDNQPLTREEYRLLGIAKQAWFGKRRKELDEDSTDETEDDSSTEEESNDNSIPMAPPSSYSKLRVFDYGGKTINEEIDDPTHEIFVAGIEYIDEKKPSSCRIITEYRTHQGTTLLGVLPECNQRLGDALYLREFVIPLVGEQPTEPSLLKDWIESVVLVLRCNLVIHTDEHPYGERIVDRCNWDGLVDNDPPCHVYVSDGKFYKVGSDRPN